MKRIALLLLVAGLQAPSGSVGLAWDANPAEDKVDGYRIEVLEPGALEPVLVEAGKVTQFRVTGLKARTTYRFRVLAHAGDMESGFSSPIEAEAEEASCAVVPGSAPEVSVIIQGYDLEAKRSDPKGLLVRFEAASSEPVVRLDLDLENDGEPAVPVTFQAGVGFDGRYIRALAFKPTVNGTWPLLVSATDAVGRKASARCAPGVTVGF